ncbi:MAG TPA: hypothetical protein VN671_01720 [Solirubrobacterales bacterium]|nr:hypothetical protein [Solirubrobacterales bacterium]
MVEFSAHQQRGVEELERLRLRAPCRVANASRNAGAELGRRRRWGSARDSLWDFVGASIEDGTRVAIVGAGNGDDLPLRRIARRAGAVTLIDLDPRAAQGARRRLGRAERAKVDVIGHDVTEGAADAIVLAALGGEEVDPVPATVGGPAPIASADAQRSASAAADLPHLAAEPDGEGRPLPGAPYDLVIGDLFYSQLLYPALVDLGVDPDRSAETLVRHAPGLTRAVVARLHASAPLVVHIHDPIAWWDGHEQPVALGEILASAAGEGTDAALDLVARGVGPHESDPRAALADLDLTPTATALWRWPFAPGVDYLACATLARSADRRA